MKHILHCVVIHFLDLLFSSFFITLLIFWDINIMITRSEIKTAYSVARHFIHLNKKQILLQMKMVFASIREVMFKCFLFYQNPYIQITLQN